MKNIYVSGSVAYDEIMDFPHYFKDYFHPEKLHQINVSFAVSDLAKHLGGIATNISYALRNTINYYSLPNSEQTTIYPVATVGKDGSDLLEFFKKNNINTTCIQQDKKLYTATGKVITDKKDNQIWGFYYGASSKFKLKWTGNQFNDFWIVAATHEKPFTAVLQHVIKNNLSYLFDPGMALTWISDDLLKKGVMNAAYVVGNDYEIAMIEKRLDMSVNEIVRKGVNVITTLGDKGVHYYGSTDSVRISISAYTVKKVVDPTGAGDAWRGGFVGALVSGKSLEECLVMGNVMASFAVESIGTVEYKVKAREIKKRIKILIDLVSCKKVGITN